jgi:hypothetical protein
MSMPSWRVAPRACLVNALYLQPQHRPKRVVALGVKPEWRQAAIAAKLYTLHYQAAKRTPQKSDEMGWILETNDPMNRAMEGLGR